MQKNRLIHIKNLSYSYGSVVLFRDISFDICISGLCLISGPSGVWKTTLLSLIWGISSPEKGIIEYDSILSPRERGFGYALIDGPFFETLSVRENIFLLENFAGVKIDMHYYRGLLNYFEIEALEFSPLISLSAWQRERVNCIRAHIHKPKVVILDEPGSNLDAHLFDKMVSFVQKNIQENHTAYVIVSHDTRFIQIASEHIELTPQ